MNTRPTGISTTPTERRLPDPPTERGLPDPRHHADLLSAGEALSYLRLDEACNSDSAARSRLNRLCQEGKIIGFTWGATRLYHRKTLDDFVAAELADLQLVRSAKALCNEADTSF